MKTAWVPFAKASTVHGQSAQKRQRRTRLAFAPATALIIAALCSGPYAYAQDNASQPAAQQMTAPVAPPDAAADEAADAKLPVIPLTSSILGQLVLAEVAAQRGQVNEAYLFYFNLARETRDPRLARRSAELAMSAGAGGSALQASRLWADTAPDSREANDTLTYLLVANGKMSEAEPRFAARIASAQDKKFALEQAFGILVRAQDHAGALLVMDHLVAKLPEIPEAHLMLAQTAWVANDHSRALAEARGVLVRQPDSEPAVLMAAQFLQTDSPAKAEAQLRAFLEQNPHSVDVRMALARLLISAKRYTDANIEFERIAHDAPNRPDTQFALGILAYQADHPEEAERYLKHYLALYAKAKTASGDNSDEADGAREPNAALMTLAQIAEDRKDIPGAMAWLDKVGPGEQFLPAQFRRAHLLAKGGKLEQALHDLGELPVASEKDRAQILMAQAQVLDDNKQWQRAFDLLDSALTKTPDDSDLLYEQAMAAEKLNHLDVMENSLRHLIKLRPDYAQAYNALGYTLADHNVRLEEAQKLIDKAVSLAPDDASIVDSKGWVSYRLGDHGKAIEHLTRALKLRDDAEIAVHLGEVLWVTGKQDEAQKFWKQAQTLEPENELLHETLNRLHAPVH